MKILLITATIAILPLVGFNQDTTTIYLNSDNEFCTKADSKYIRKVIKKETRKYCIDYYDSGSIQQEGSCNDDSAKVKTGEWREYFESGKLSGITNYNNDGQFHGKINSMYENGNLKSEGNYTLDSMNGDWYWYRENGEKCAHEKYENGKMTEITFWNHKGKIQKNPQREVEPEFPGGQEKMVKFLISNLQYPQKAVEDKIMGKVILSFVVEKDGSISQIKIMQSAHELLDAEAIRVVKAMPAWNPGMQHNLPVRVRYTLPLVFQF